MENYIVINELPDAHVGTKVIWDESANAFYYEKSVAVSPHFRNYLSAGTVTQTPEFFRKEGDDTCAKTTKLYNILNNYYLKMSELNSISKFLDREKMKLTFTAMTCNDIENVFSENKK